MCSFLITNKKIDNIDRLNRNLKRRGPDNTTVIQKDGITYIHNLLHITGQKTLQPLIHENDVLLYNGEVYNYYGDCDTSYVFGKLRKEGIEAVKSFDGEFAIVYKNNNSIYLACDIFGTKPIYYSKDNDNFGVSSFYTALEELNFNNIQKLEANTILELQSNARQTVFDFNLIQTNDTFEIFEESFLKSVEKRITKKSFLSLSSGYDSGAIALASKILNKPVTFYCIPNNENKDIIKERERFLGNITYIDISENEYTKHYNYINNFADSYFFDDYSFLQDRASVGLSFIFERAKKEGLNVSISGSGADEIITDYGINGRGVFPFDNSSTLKGIFPEDLKPVFPWNNFFKGRQERYLSKEESVAGSHGIETRYPFLDRNCVQSFLNVSTKFKNLEYKAPLAYLFKKHNFPYEPFVKRGFNL